jgi:hypothetical protein
MQKTEKTDMTRHEEKSQWEERKIKIIREDDRSESVRDGPMAGEEDEIGKEEAGGKEEAVGGYPMRGAGSLEVEKGDVKD